MDGADEQLLIGRAQRGDDEAYERLLAELVDPAHRLACGLLHDSFLAEDAVQESALKAWRKLSNIKPGMPIRPWFLGIVANQCRETKRGHWSRLVTRSELPQRDPSPELDATNRAFIRSALARLSREERLVIVLRYYVDLPWAEVAEISRTTEAGARTRLYRAVSKLRPLIRIPVAT
jgi:RNA polymerase sigma-70 factor (ECF subfamily)